MPNFLIVIIILQFIYLFGLSQLTYMEEIRGKLLTHKLRDDDDLTEETRGMHHDRG